MAIAAAAATTAAHILRYWRGFFSHFWFCCWELVAENNLTDYALYMPFSR